MRDGQLTCTAEPSSTLTSSDNPLSMDDATIGPVGVDDPAVQSGETRSTDRRRLWRIGAQKVATHNHSSVLEALTVTANSQH